MTQSAYEQGRRIAQRTGERYPQARHYLERGTQAVSEAPLVSLLAVGAVGFALAWMLGGGQSRSEGRSSYRAKGPQGPRRSAHRKAADRERPC